MAPKTAPAAAMMALLMAVIGGSFTLGAEARAQGDEASGFGSVSIEADRAMDHDNHDDHDQDDDHHDDGHDDKGDPDPDPDSGADADQGAGDDEDADGAGAGGGAGMGMGGMGKDPWPDTPAQPDRPVLSEADNRPDDDGPPPRSSFGDRPAAAIPLRVVTRPVSDFSPDTVLIMLAAGTDPQSVANEVGFLPLSVTLLPSVGVTMMLAPVPPGASPLDVARRASGAAGVVSAQPNYFYQPMMSSPQNEEGLAAMGMAAPIPVGGAARIAMIDTGVERAHEEFQRSTLREVRVHPLARPAAHGTAIASLLVGSGAVQSVARGAALTNYAAFASARPGEVSLSATVYLAEAIDAAIRQNPTLLVMSFGGRRDDPLLRILCDAAAQRGIVVLAAAGNGGAGDAAPYPAAYPSVIAVTAIDKERRLYANATTGAHVDLAGPGVNLLAAAPEGYMLASGTSFATAIVAGVALRERLRRPGLPLAQLRALLERNAIDLGAPGRDPLFGAGLARAVNR